MGTTHGCSAPSCLPRETGQPETSRRDRQLGRRKGQLTHGLTAKPVPGITLTQAGPVEVNVFDAAGRGCASLFSGRMKAGMQTLSLDTRRLANGVYFLRLEAEAATRSTRLVVSH